MESWTYGDFDTDDSTAAQAYGKFYYDETGEHSRAEWSPYIDGVDAMQVWVAKYDEPSNYYVQAGQPPICIYFGIRDDAAGGNPISIEKAGWMQACDDAGLASFEGREEEVVNGESVWVDHWSCRMDYEAANESITFQNWHTIGTESLPAGLPVRVTGGNSAPDATEGQPRLNTVWYYNFTYEVDDWMWVPPDGKDTVLGQCLGVSKEQAETYFGYEPTKQHMYSHDFQRRAHHLPHHSPTEADVARAAQPKPRRKYAGENFGDAMTTLNAQLLVDTELRTKSCDDFTMEELFAVEDMLFFARSHELQAVYDSAKDTRSIAHATIGALRAEQRGQAKTVEGRPDLLPLVRDGVCHEAVMWFVHHTSDAAKAELRHLIELPLLPVARHEERPAHDEHGVAAHDRYTQSVSCAICHVVD